MKEVNTYLFVVGLSFVFFLKPFDLTFFLGEYHQHLLYFTLISVLFELFFFFQLIFIL